MGIGIRNLEGPSGGKVGCEGWGPRSSSLPSATRSYKQIGAGRTCANVRMRACLFSYANIVWDINFDAVHFPMHMCGCRSEKTLPDTHPCAKSLLVDSPHARRDSGGLTHVKKFHGGREGIRVASDAEARSRQMTIGTLEQAIPTLLSTMPHMATGVIRISQAWAARDPDSRYCNVKPCNRPLC